MSPRALLLPFVAVLAVALVLGVQLASGGGDFRVTTPASPCDARPLAAATTNLDALAQEIVLGGIDQAACDLHVTRERLVLALPDEHDRAALLAARRTDEAGLESSFKAGMTTMVRRLVAARRLPATSALLKANADALGLPGIAVTALEQVPANVIDGLLPVEGVLTRAIDGIDLGVVLDGLGDDPGALDDTLRSAIAKAATDEARSQLLSRVPDSLRGLLGG